ncbi:MAG: hypothetical protein GY859_42955 [Desulfobacterales bacterium]|nr:hypothetical protein [Desulfobacterales bacterium]
MNGVFGVEAAGNYFLQRAFARGSSGEIDTEKYNSKARKAYTVDKECENPFSPYPIG